MRILALVMLLLLPPTAALGEVQYVVNGGAENTTGPATSCARADVVSTLARVTASTTAVYLGPTATTTGGTCEWTGPTAPSVTVPSGSTGLLIRGSGTITSGYGSAETTIIDSITTSQETLRVNSGSNSNIYVRVAGLKFRGNYPTGAAKNQGFLYMNGLARMRVDHNIFDTNINMTASKMTGYGVYDHNTTDNQLNTTGPSGHVAWTEAALWGQADKWVYVEDNIQTHNLLMDCNQGGRLAARFNTALGGFQTHPTGGGGFPGRGCRAEEIYANDSSSFQFGTFNFHFHSSGPGLIWGNTATSDPTYPYSHFITLHSMRRNNSTYTQGATPNGWGYCGTSFNGTGSNWDENSVTTTGYRCIDQPGSGRGDLLSGTAPNVINATTGCDSSQACAWPRQDREPVYEWLNTHARPSSYSVITGTITENLDYYAYKGNTSCNQNAAACTAGVGAGELGQRPAQCTTGVGWWATNQGSWNSGTNAFYTGQGLFYKCTSTDTWELLYTPLAYPHPWIAGSEGTPQPPEPPPAGTGTSPPRGRRHWHFPRVYPDFPMNEVMAP